jgi:alpha/beta superfamily hydrolase
MNYEERSESNARSRQQWLSSVSLGVTCAAFTVQHMNENDQIMALLTRIEENQRKALETQEKHLALAQAQLDRSNRTIQESIELQRSSAARQTQAIRIILPLVGVLLVLLGYLLFKYRIL